jgi:hypothetical protein
MGYEKSKSNGIVIYYKAALFLVISIGSLILLILSIVEIWLPIPEGTQSTWLSIRQAKGKYENILLIF